MSISDTVTARARPGGSVAKLTKSLFKNAMLAIAIAGGTATAASAETLLMPDAQFLAGVSEVVWGITTLPNSTGVSPTTYDIDFGDGSAHATGNVTDGSYIAVNHNYAVSNPNITVTLKVTNGGNTETATAKVNAYNGPALTADALRQLNVNRAIQSGLRYLWTAQDGRTNFATTATASWGGYAGATVALVVQAFQNQGFQLPNDNSIPSDIYRKYVVRRGLNYMINNLTAVNVCTVSPNPNGAANVGGSDQSPPGVLPPTGSPFPGTNGGDSCNALYSSTTGVSGYENGMVLFALSGSGALNRKAFESTNPSVPTGETYGQILQRVANASAWGTSGAPDATYAYGQPNFCRSDAGQGGWIYTLRSGGADGSTAGWELLGLLDAQSVGAVIPSWVQPTWANCAMKNSINTDGSFDYRADANPASDYLPNMAKTGIGLQGLFFAGAPASDPRVSQAIAWITKDWPKPANNPTTWATLSGYSCGSGQDTYSNQFGCLYGLFNVFKGLKLYGVQTLPAIANNAPLGGAITAIGYTPPTGTSLAADDWYAAVVDQLVAKQWYCTNNTGASSSTCATGDSGRGDWYTWAYFSGATGGTPQMNTAVPLLILAPTALVLPDPTTFATLGLQQGSPLSTNPATNPVTNPPGTHTVTGITLSAAGSPIPSVSITFNVISGPNAGSSGSGTTDATGKATFTYTDNGGAGTDNIQASVGNLKSNILVKNWIVPVAACDMNNDGKVDSTDINAILALRNVTSSSPRYDPRADANGDGVINVIDARICTGRCTNANCAP